MSNLIVPKSLAVLLALTITLSFVLVPDNPQRDQRVDPPVAAVVIDMQPLYLMGITEREKRREIPNILNAIEFCHDNGIALYCVEMEKAGETIPELKEKLDEYGAIYVPKSKNSTFEDTDFAELLSDEGIDTIFLMGINASVCVRETAEDALELGFRICTSKELIAEPPVWHRGYKTYESIAWYTEKGVYCDKFEDLLYVLSMSLEDPDAFDNIKVEPPGTLPT